MTDNKPGRTMLFTEQLIQEGEIIVAYCPELDISSCGDTVAQARANLQTALRLFLEEAAKMGTLGQILAEAGYDTDSQILYSPTISVERRELVLAEPIIIKNNLRTAGISRDRYFELLAEV